MGTISLYNLLKDTESSVSIGGKRYSTEFDDEETRQFVQGRILGSRVSDEELDMITSTDYIESRVERIVEYIGEKTEYMKRKFRTRFKPNELFEGEICDAVEEVLPYIDVQSYIDPYRFGHAQIVYGDSVVEFCEHLVPSPGKGLTHFLAELVIRNGVPGGMLGLTIHYLLAAYESAYQIPSAGMSYFLGHMVSMVSTVVLGGWASHQDTFGKKCENLVKDSHQLKKMLVDIKQRRK